MGAIEVSTREDAISWGETAQSLSEEIDRRVFVGFWIPVVTVGLGGSCVDGVTSEVRLQWATRGPGTREQKHLLARAPWLCHLEERKLRSSSRVRRWGPAHKQWCSHFMAAAHVGVTATRRRKGGPEVLVNEQSESET